MNLKNLFCLAAVLGLAACSTERADVQRQARQSGWTETLKPGDTSFSSAGRNQFFILEPGYQLVFEGKEHGEQTRLVITVLSDTKMVDGVETRVVEERETQNGKLSELALNYFALGQQTHNVYYFGEDVDAYKDGKVSHEGSWLAGIKGAKPGIMAPANPQVGQRYYQENAPKEAMDRSEIVSMTKTVTTPAGTFKNCMATKETTPLEPSVTEHKVYAPEVGLIQDGTLKLVSHGFANK